MSTKLLKYVSVVCIAAMLLLTASCGQKQEDTLSVAGVYQETAQRFLDDGDYDSAITVLEEGVEATNDESLAALLAETIAKRAVQSGDGEESPEAVTPAPSQNVDAPTWGTALSGIAYFGDPSACTMTRAQAEAYVQVLENEIQKVSDGASGSSGESTAVPRAYAALLDLGNGIPALLFGSGVEMDFGGGAQLMGTYSDDFTVWGIWQLMGDQPVKMENQNATFVYADHIYVDDYYLRIEAGGVDARVYPIENGQIELTPSTSVSGIDLGQTGNIDGQQATEDQLNAWFDQWNPSNSLAGYTHGSAGGVGFWGLSPAEDILDAIDRALSGSTLTSWPDASTVSDIPVEIQRMNLYSDNDSVEVYFDIPVFPSGGPVYQSITNFFSAREEEAFASVHSMVEDLPVDVSFWDTYTTSVVGRTGKLISFMLQSDTGTSTAIHPFMSTEYYTFRTDTGERVYLSDLVDASPEEIESFLLSALSARNEETNGIINLDTFRTYRADDYSFDLRDGKVFVEFGREEGVSYADGFIDPIEMTMGLKPVWKD